MEFHDAHLIAGAATAGDDCSVRSDARLVEVFQKTANGGHPFLFVQDGEGAPVGLLAAEDILKRVTDPNPNEMVRWMDMPAEAALQSRLAVPAGTVRAVDDQTDITKVTVDGVLMGVITQEDVLISWKSIQRTLKNSQGDAVTGLPNRATFDQHLQAESNRAERCHHSLGVILIDLDDFKSINDTYGHAAGDTALTTVATALRKSLRSYDMVARFGGDEFAVVCSGCRSGEIDIVVRRVREKVLALQEDMSMPRPLPTISVGAAVIQDVRSMKDTAELIEAADQCLYVAKRCGRNCAFKIEFSPGSEPEAQFVEDAYANYDKVMTGLNETTVPC